MWWILLATTTNASKCNSKAAQNMSEAIREGGPPVIFDSKIDVALGEKFWVAFFYDFFYLDGRLLLI